MNRRILLQVTAPAILIGLLLLAACVGGAWSTYRFQKDLDTIRTQSVESLKAAQQLEISVLQLRYHCARFLTDPTSDSDERILKDQEDFHKSLASAKQSARTQTQREVLAKIEPAYR